jgi:hypothetical protein
MCVHCTVHSDLPLIEKAEKKDLPLIEKAKKKAPTRAVSFCATVRVCLVPSRSCLASFSDELFWAPEDYKNFKAEAMFEIRATLDAYNKIGDSHWSHRDVRDYLYQPMTQPAQGVPSSSSKHNHALERKPGLLHSNQYKPEDEEVEFREEDIADVSWYQQAVTDMQDIVSKAWDPTRHKQLQDQQQQQLHPSLGTIRRVDSVQLFKQYALAGLAGGKNSAGENENEKDMERYQQQVMPSIDDPDPSLNRLMRRVDSVQLFKQHANSINALQRTENIKPSEPLPIEDFACLDLDGDIDSNNGNFNSPTVKGKISSSTGTSHFYDGNNSHNNSGSYESDSDSGSSSYGRSNSGSYSGRSNFSSSSSSSGGGGGGSSGSSSSGSSGGSNSNANGSTNYCNNCIANSPRTSTFRLSSSGNNINNNNHRSDSGNNRGQISGSRSMGKLELSIIPVVLPV